MLAFDYSRSIATAQRLIARFGQTGAIRRITSTGSPHDPALTATDYSCTLVDDPEGWEASEIAGTLIQATDKKLYVSTAGLTIDPGEADKIVVGGAEYQIVQTKKMAPAGVTVMWIIAARG